MIRSNLASLASTAKTASTQYVVLRSLANLNIVSAIGFIMYATLFQTEKAAFIAIPILCLLASGVWFFRMSNGIRKASEDFKVHYIKASCVQYKVKGMCFPYDLQDTLPAPFCHYDVQDPLEFANIFQNRPKKSKAINASFKLFKNFNATLK